MKLYVYGSSLGEFHHEDIDDNYLLRWWEGEVFEFVMVDGVYHVNDQPTEFKSIYEFMESLPDRRKYSYGSGDPRWVIKVRKNPPMPSWLNISDDGINISDKD